MKSINIDTSKITNCVNCDGKLQFYTIIAKPGTNVSRQFKCEKCGSIVMV